MHQWLCLNESSRDRKPRGPFPEPQFVSLIKNGEITGDFLINSPTRTKGEWVRAAKYPPVAKILNQLQIGSQALKNSPPVPRHRTPKKNLILVLVATICLSFAVVVWVNYFLLTNDFKDQQDLSEALHEQTLEQTRERMEQSLTDEKPRRDPVEEWKDMNNLEKISSKTIQGTTVYLGITYSRVYVPENIDEDFEAGLGSIFLGVKAVIGYQSSDDIEIKEQSGGFVSIGGAPIEFQLSSSNQSIEVHDDGSIGIRGKDSGHVELEVADNSISVSLDVQVLPIVAGGYDSSAFTSKQVVTAIGIPDQKEDFYVPDYDSERIDGIPYSGAAVTHWYYDKFPGAVIAFIGGEKNGRVHAIGTRKIGP